MHETLRRKHRFLCHTIKKWILFSGITMVFLTFTACGEQESKKAEEKTEAQEDADSEWTGLISPQDAHDMLEKKSSDEQEEPDTHKPLKKVYIGDTNVLCGVYIAEEGEYARGIGPKLSLYPNGEGDFHVHSASSYIASGGYEAAGGKLILTDEFSDEPQDIYTFEIADNKLIFLADESAEVWDYGPGTAADGMVFVYDEEQTEWYMAEDLD